MDATMDDIPEDLIRRFGESEIQITYDNECYSILDTSIPMTIADGFFAWVDALVFLEEEAKLISKEFYRWPIPNLAQMSIIGLLCVHDALMRYRCLSER